MPQTLTKDAMIRARITSDLKFQAEEVLKKLGISPTEAINIFYSQIVLRKGIPFEIRLEGADLAKNYTTVKSKKHLKSMMGLK